MTVTVRIGSNASCEPYVTDQLQRFYLDHDQSLSVVSEPVTPEIYATTDGDEVVCGLVGNYFHKCLDEPPVDTVS